LKRGLPGALRIALVVGAIWALRHELDGVSAAGLAQQIRAFGWSHITVGVTCTVASFLLLGVIELLALRHASDASARRVPVGAALRTAFVANALSQSIGIALLTGAAVRARAYARHGLDSIAIAQTTAFVTIAATVGLLAAGAVALVSVGSTVTAGSLVVAARPTALLLAGIVIAYLAWSVAGKADGVGRGRWRIPRPTPRMAIGQITLSAADWLAAAGALYAFVPTHFGLTLGVVLGTYMIAQTVAVTSHVPAGAGVFEVMVVSLLSQAAPAAPRAALVAALVMFRLVYYVAPLCAAIVVALVSELSGANDSRSHSARERAVAIAHQPGQVQRAS
jgi:phosphatidylglycerol lysyltransferase